MKMKRNVFLVGIIGMMLIIGFSLTGCVSNPVRDIGVYETSIPEDQYCTLEIAGGLQVINFNELDVKWAINDEGAWKEQQKGHRFKTIIKIPSGSNTLRVDFYQWQYDQYPGSSFNGTMGTTAGYLRVDGLEISHDFLSGHTYFLRPVKIQRLLGKDIESDKYGFSDDNWFGKVGGNAYKLRIEEGGKTVAEGKVITF
jgi:hypothetical protein